MAWIELKCDKCFKRKLQDSSECIDELKPGEYIELPNPCDCGGEFWIIDYYGNPVSLTQEVKKRNRIKDNETRIRS